MTQTELDWDPKAHARRESLPTSRAAAETVKESAKVVIAKVLNDLKMWGPGTFSTIAKRSGLRESQVWKRLSDLKNRGLIEPTHVTEKGPTGRQQMIWRFSVK